MQLTGEARHTVLTIGKPDDYRTSTLLRARRKNSVAALAFQHVCRGAESHGISSVLMNFCAPYGHLDLASAT